ncbi:MAG: helix-turn-helix domain-containing protein [Pseudonocardiaceae bacterium]
MTMVITRARQIRYARDKSLAVIAGLAGISEGHLSRIERGERALARQPVSHRGPG